jgi:adiponectin receptor
LILFISGQQASLYIQMRTNKYESEIMLSSVNKKMKEIEQEETLLQYVDDQMHETWDSAKAAMIGAQRLLLFHELPKEWQENEYVLSG